MRFSFDDNDDLVLEDIPDDMIETVAKLALERRISDEDMWREIIGLWSKEYSA